ncbi:MAG: hypothetical protein HKN82_06185 [Akkermansiaceae bacterium]|nr:hypothetical protein [Akkermansiaceae bacterium]NNM31299.1 hypothetical protein [Akkermansiaceae bacterium]
MKRPSLGSAFREASRRARLRTNQRLWRRRGLTSMQSTIAGTGYAPPGTIGLLGRLGRILVGVLLLLPCAITTITLFQRVTDPHFAGHFWKTTAFIYFAIGFVINAGWFLTRLFQPMFLYLYVLGHELTHAVFVYLCFGRVSGFRVGLDGGHIVTNKSNLLIALSPYFVPFWSVVALGIMAGLSFVVAIPYQDRLLFALIGGTWSFHIFWTLWIIPRDQPDLKENGTFLSLAIIYLANVVLLSGLICLASPDLSWRDFVYNWANNGLDLGGHLLQGLESLPARPW